MKRKYLSIIIACAGILAALCGLAVLYIYWDFTHYIDVNSKAKYNSDCVIMIQKSGCDNFSIYSKMFKKGNGGARVSMLDTDGTVTRLLDIKDGVIDNAYVINNTLFVECCTGKDWISGNYEELKMKLIKVELDTKKYTEEEYNRGEIVAVKDNAEDMILLSDIPVQNELKSNSVLYDGAVYYIDGENLMSYKDNKSENVMKVSTKNYCTLSIDSGYVCAGDGNKYCMMELSGKKEKVICNDTKDVICLRSKGADAYLCYKDTVKKVTFEGDGKDIYTLKNAHQDEKICDVKTENETISIFTNYRYIVCSPDGEILKQQMYSEPIIFDCIGS